MIRPAREADIASLVAITLANYHGVFARLLDCDWASYDAAFFLKRFETSLKGVTVLEMKSAVVGFAMITNYHIDMFFVDPRVQGNGIGAHLLTAIEAAGAASLECFAANTGARRFYERHGWQPTDSYRRIFAGAECDFCRYEKR